MSPVASDSVRSRESEPIVTPRPSSKLMHAILHHFSDFGYQRVEDIVPV
jgi:hypothetical protein